MTLPMQMNPNCTKPFKPPRRSGQQQPPIGDENAGRNDSPVKDSPPKLHGSPKGPLLPSNEAAPSVATTSAATYPPSAEALSRHLPATMNSRTDAIAEMSSDGEAKPLVARVPPNLTSLPPGQSSAPRFFTMEGEKIPNPNVERLGRLKKTDRRKRATAPYLRDEDGCGAWLAASDDGSGWWLLDEPDRFPKAAPHTRRNSAGEAASGKILAKEAARDGQGCACAGLPGRPCLAELGGDYFGTTLKPSAFGVDHTKVPSILSKRQKRVATQEVDSGLAQFLCCYCAADKQACVAGPEGSAKNFKPLV